MCEEEKKALETLKEVASDDFDTLGDDISPKMAQNILDVISKQRKEIEEKNIAINKMSKDISRQLEEIEEKSTIIMAGAEKVKQLEKEIEALEIIHNTYKEMIEENNYISKDKIKELKEKVEKEMISNPYDFSYMINELLEEK